MKVQKDHKKKEIEYKKKYEKPVARLMKVNFGVWSASVPCCCLSCLSSSTMIATPLGNINVKKIKVGQLVYSANEYGKKICVPVVKTSKVFVSKTHKIIYIALEDGRKLLVSPTHPLIGTKKICQLAIGAKYDGSIISDFEILDYEDKYTYDLLPESATGYYWANGILIGSTLHYQKDTSYEELKKLFSSVRFL